MYKYIACLLLVTGCATSSVSPYGKDTYLLTVSDLMGMNHKVELRARAAQEANAHCVSLGKQLKVEKAEDRGIAWLTSTSSQVIFSCI